MDRALPAALAALMLFWFGGAQAAVLHSGTISNSNEGGEYFSRAGSGIYTFTSEAKIVDFYDFSATALERFDAHSDDGKFWWGSNRFQAVSWDYLGVPPPKFSLTPTGFTWRMAVPAARWQHSDDCYFGELGACGYEEEYDYAIEIYMFLRFEEGSAGKSFLVEYSPLPDVPAPVPEPSTWAMLIAGFAIVGAGLRRSRAQREAPNQLQQAS